MLGVRTLLYLVGHPCIIFVVLVEKAVLIETEMDNIVRGRHDWIRNCTDT